MPVLSQFRLLTINLFCSSFSHFTETKTRIIIIINMSIEWNSLCICCVCRVYTQTYLNFSRSLYVIALFSSSSSLNVGSISLQFHIIFLFIYGSPKEQVLASLTTHISLSIFICYRMRLLTRDAIYIQDIYPLIFRSSSYFTLRASFTHFSIFSSIGTRVHVYCIVYTWMDEYFVYNVYFKWIDFGGFWGRWWGVWRIFWRLWWVFDDFLGLRLTVLYF